MPKEKRRQERGNYFEPDPSEIPKGICECGCGKGPTGKAHRTEPSKRWFKGYPVPYLQGHSRAGLRRGSDHPNWRGNKRKDKKGYIILWRPGHPNADKQGHIYEQRLIMSELIGRPLRDDETVHHINGKRDDNRPENLQIHHKDHGTGIRYQCLSCGSHNVQPVPI